MRFITFKTIESKNFLSFGDKLAKIKINSGVNAIVGTNLDKEDSKNGAGKSSITEMLHYALYGSTIREISKDYIQNSITQKRMELDLEFDVTQNSNTDTYKISRKLNPTKCQLFKNEVEITRSTLAKTNELIQEIIHTPSTVFQNSVIMSANNALPFMAMSKVDKRKFIESILGLEIFSSMVLKARDELNTTKKDYDVAYSSLEQFQTELTFNQSQLQNYEAINEAKKSKLEQKRNDIVKDIEFLQLKIITNIPSVDQHKKQISEATTNLVSLKEKLQATQSKLIKAEAESNSIYKQVNKLKENKDLCPTCNRTYSSEHVDHSNDLIKKHETSINLYKQAANKLTKDITSLKQTISVFEQTKENSIQSINSIQSQIAENNVTLARISHLNGNLKEINEEISHVVLTDNNELKGKIASLIEVVEEKKTLVDTLNNNLNILETVKFILSEEGIKSFIVKKIITVLNARLAIYLKKLESNCLCKFNEFFEEEVIDENGHPKSYFNFSGGERKRIDLACLFAFADIRRLQGDVNFSTIFYDELFDSSLDDRGIILTLKILRERFQENNESCYVITHRGMHGAFKVDHTINVVKRNGITSVAA